MIALDQKPAALQGGQAPSPTPAKWGETYGDGVPLFWRESKSTEFWTALIEDFHFTAIVDLTPGSGALAEASLRKGVHYLGVCFDEIHQSWLQNRLDQVALHEIVKNGTPLYEQNLAMLVKTQFADVVGGELNKADVGDDAEEPDEGEEALDEDTIPLDGLVF
jgi:hypothetical protein